MKPPASPPPKGARRARSAGTGSAAPVAGETADAPARQEDRSSKESRSSQQDRLTRLSLYPLDFKTAIEAAVATGRPPELEKRRQHERKKGRRTPK